jgi:hypothetical protein
LQEATRQPPLSPLLICKKTPQTQSHRPRVNIRSPAPNSISGRSRAAAASRGSPSPPSTSLPPGLRQSPGPPPPATNAPSVYATASRYATPPCTLPHPRLTPLHVRRRLQGCRVQARRCLQGPGLLWLRHPPSGSSLKMDFAERRDANT